MAEDEKLIACCGLDCTECDMRLAVGKPELQREIADWFRDNLHKEIDPATVGCTWCRGEREGHWSADCWILKCCVDLRGRDTCASCPEFPCPKLVDWAGQNDRYADALARLRELRLKLQSC